MTEPKVYLAHVFQDICKELNIPLNWITNKQEVIDCMRLYAHFMCEKQKEICADNAEADYNWVGKDEEFNYVPMDIEVYILKQSVLQCTNAMDL